MATKTARKTGRNAAAKGGGRKTAARKATARKGPAQKATARKAPARKAPARKAAGGNYTDPALRERLKRRILAGTKGGRAGQWSARKAQLLAHEYEAQGGGYSGRKTATQRHLGEWTREEWTTADGAPARRGRKTTARYLPKRAWEALTPAERRRTDEKKRAGSQRGEQFVANTKSAAEARRGATKGAAKRPAAKRPAAKRPAA